MSEHVSECINADLTSSTGIANDLVISCPDSLGAWRCLLCAPLRGSCVYIRMKATLVLVSLPISIITSSAAVTFLQDLTFYFQNHFQFPPVPGSPPEINISDLIKPLSHVQRSLTQHLP